MNQVLLCTRSGHSHEVWCVTCLMQGKHVQGSLEDFAHRCPKHLPDDAPHLIYIDPFVLQAYLKFVPRKRTIIVGLGDL